MTSSDVTPPNTVNDLERVATGLRGCFDDLGSTTVSEEDLRSMATLIHESMSGPARTFHSTQHIFDISQSANSVQTLAAYFHDLVYYHIDGGLTDAQAALLKDVVVEQQQQLEGNHNTVVSIANTAANEWDEAVALTLVVFGFERGQVLNPFGGLNEFLSAVVAAKLLDTKVSRANLLQIVACIEATIPFRAQEDVGERLHARLETANNTLLALQIGPDELVQATQWAIGLANQDIANFANAPDAFLANSWTLMPETNVPLREDTWASGEQFQISEFAVAVQKMIRFFAVLQPEVVFHQFRGYPDDETYKDLQERVRTNLDIARKYMNGKMMCASFLGSVAELTGGDNPVSHWAQQNHNNEDERAEPVHPMPELKVYKGVRLDERVFDLLNKTVGTEIAVLDIHQTATAPLLYGMMGDEAIQASLEFAAVPMDEERAKQFLDSLPKEALVPLLSNMQTCCIPSRKKALQKLLEEYVQK